VVRQADFCIVAVGAVSTRRLLSAEGSHVTKATSHTGSITERFGGFAERVRRWDSRRRKCPTSIERDPNDRQTRNPARRSSARAFSSARFPWAE
jgi:hypothetical protein